MKNKTKILSLILIFALVTAIALFASGCADKKSDATPNTTVTETTGTVTDTTGTVTHSSAENDKTTAESPSDEEVTKLGEGKKTFNFTVKDADRKETNFEIKSDKATVGEALTDAGLISGTQSEYGLMVDTVMGIKADYNIDKAYWAFYIGGEYAQTGVDSTELVDGEYYMLEYTKG